MASKDWNHMQFRQWVRGELRRREWNDSDFARRLNRSTGTVSRWLSGERRPNPAACDQIADVLNADLDLVLALVGHRPADASAPPPDEIAPLIAMLRRIDPRRDRIEGIRGTLLAWLEMDRAQGVTPPEPPIEEDDPPDGAVDPSLLDDFATQTRRLLRKHDVPEAVQDEMLARAASAIERLPTTSAPRRSGHRA